MSLKPIDMQVLLPKLHKNDMLKPRIIHQVENEQALAGNNNKQVVEEKLNRVNTFDQRENPKVKDDKNRKPASEQDQQAKKDAKDSEEEKEESGKPKKQAVKRQHLDIKV